MDAKLYEELNKSWKSTCRILFGEELGEMKEYNDWLRNYSHPTPNRKSHLSGKEVTMTFDQYPASARFISFDEVKGTTAAALNINEIKDIDSIVRAVSESWEYTGNKILGNSAALEACDIAIDSQYIAEGINVQKVDHSFAVSNATIGKYIFGSTLIVNGEFMLKFNRGTNNKRCFESTFTYYSSDMYFSHNCQGCHDMLFSFHQFSKRDCIGNLELQKDKYLELKKKLLSEIAGEIRKNKRYPSIFDLVPNEKVSKDVKLNIPVANRKEDMSPIEKSFASTSKIILKKELTPIEEYEGWLSKRIVPIEELDTPFGAQTYLPEYERLQLSLGIPKKRQVNPEEAMELGKLRINEADAEDLEEIKAWLAKTGCFIAELFVGQNFNTIKSTILVNASNVYKCAATINAEYVGVDSWAMLSKHMFGCHWATDSQFSMKCYNSYKLNRCFELDTCNNCSDTYFSHNCEGMTEAMFCFNTRSKRYAIGNTQIAPDQYRKIKDAVLEQIASELANKKDLKWDIFNIGAPKAK